MPEVALPDGFEWARYPWGPAIRCRPLADAADHCFTTRAPVLEVGPLTARDGWNQIALSMGVSTRSVVRLHQVHGTQVVILARRQPFPPIAADWNVGDVAASDDPAMALCVKVADCVPILLADARRGAVAAIHAGWRGTAAGAAKAAVEALRLRFEANPADLVAAIGPSIGPCCYRVGQEVRAAFEATATRDDYLDAWFRATPAAEPLHGVPGTDPAASGRGPALFLDVWRANADQLHLAGIPAAQIHVSRLCTSCHRETFHSYRVEGEKAGRMAAVIRPRPGNVRC